MRELSKIVGLEQANSPLSLVALSIAHSYVGEREVPAGSNAGPFVEGCLRLVGLGKGFAWCQAFMYRIFQEAAQLRGVQNPVPRTAGVLKCWQMVKAGEKLSRMAEPKPGDQFIMDYGRGLGHTGIVVSVEGNTFTTIEGNTDAAGSRTGGMVCLRSRRRDDPKMRGYIRY